LRSAAVFEEISIFDLEKLIAVTNMNDIRTAFEGFLLGSEKHLRPYMNVLAEHKISISCSYLSQEESTGSSSSISLLFFKNRS